MQFPLDHNTHADSEVEWWYFWGHLSNDTFFHFARFATKVGGFRGQATHFSTHNHESTYYEELVDDLGMSESRAGFVPGRRGNRSRFHLQFKKVLGLTCFPQSAPVVHDVTHNRNYYSIPHLLAEGHFLPGERVTGDVWFDHEFSRFNEFKGWDWISLKLDSGMWVMAYDCDIDRFCTVGLNGTTIKSEFVIEGNILKVLDLGMTFTMIPTVEEKIFDPKFGVKYSEVPFYAYATVGAYPVMSGKRLGAGMRERTRRDGNS